MANTIAIKVLADAKTASKSLKTVSSDVETVGKKSKLASSNVAAFAGGAAVSFGASALSNAAKAAGEHELSLKKLSQAQKANSGLSGTTISALKEQASATESLTGAKLDEDDVITAQQQLLRAGIQGRENYDRAVLASANLAVGTNTTAAASSKTLAKALQAPEKAAALLRKSGVKLTQAQQDQIKAFQASGNTAAAQGVVLDAVGKKYDGVAKLAGETTAGKIGKLQDQFEDTARDLIGKFLPAASATLGILSKYSGIIVPVVGALAALVLVTKAIKAAQAAATAVQTAWTAATSAGAVVSKVAAAGQWLLNAALSANPIGLVIVGIVALVAAIVIAYKKSETFRRIVQGAFKGVQIAIGWVVTAIKAYAGWWVSTFRTVTGKVKDFATFLAVTYTNIKAWFFDKIQAITGKVGGWIGGGFKVAAGKLRGFVTFIKGVWKKIDEFFGKIKTAASDVGGAIWRGIIGSIAAAYNKLPGFVKSGISKIPGLGGLDEAFKALDQAAPKKPPATVNQTNNYNVRTVPTSRETSQAARRQTRVNGRS